MDGRCYCGDSVAFGSVQMPDAVCRASCLGDFEQICGGSNMLSLYSSDGKWKR